MNFNLLLKQFSDKGCKKIYIKLLSPNDNSKNQVYLGGDFSVLNILPFGEITEEGIGDWKRQRFKTRLDFYWLNEDGRLFNAPDAKLILYPKYPEVRFSGFLQGCENPPSALLNVRMENRLLFLGVAENGKIIGFVSSPESEISTEFNHKNIQEKDGIFYVIHTDRHLHDTDSRFLLIRELARIHNTGWINSKRLGSRKEILPCNSSNCGGYTLEAELGITPNGYAEPDFLGWEIKQFNVLNFHKMNSSVITLMTPEPTGGHYVEHGVESFIRRYGYADKRGRAERMNFGGIYKAGLFHTATKLTLMLSGFDQYNSKIIDINGSINLIDQDQKVAASWSFSSLLKHWGRKHARAAYIPSLCQKDPVRKYLYGDKVLLCTGTDFIFFLKQLSYGHIYYDPGIKLENFNTNPKIKRRSQFRIKSLYLSELYSKSELIKTVE